jgi:hypothetical protein
MQSFRKRDSETGVLVEAVKLTSENVKQVADWCNGTEVKEIDALDSSKTYVGINFLSWEGLARASEGDYIVKDHLDEFHTRWAVNFEDQFEAVD